MRLLSLLVLLAAAPPQTEAEKIVSRVSETYRSYRDVEVPFTQKKFLTILSDPVESSGTAMWRPNRVLFRTLKPEKSEVLVTQEEILIWVPSIGRVEKYDRRKFHLMETLDLAAGRNVRETLSRFVVRTEAAPDGEKADILVCTPKEKTVAKYVKSLRLRVRRSDSRISRVEYTDSADDRTVIEFDVDKLRANQGLTDEQIRLSAPEGTKVVEPFAPEE